ncbi:MAG: hypothetical protein KC516_02600 [Nanoarchaeota archaeon]|nr:hypothetical protein [Nanoarchaeota archaeon]
MVKKFPTYFVIYLISIIFFFSFVSSATVLDELHLNIQTLDTSTGEITAGTFDFVFNISNESDCSPVIYSNSTTLTTDNRGIISYYLENVNLDFDEQYYLCYYRDGVLINNSKIARSPYSFQTKNSTTSGLIVDSNLDFGSYNVTASYFVGDGSQLTGISGSQISNDLNWINASIANGSYVPYSGADSNVDLGSQNITTTGTGFFGWLGSLGNRISKLFVTDVDISNDLVVGGNLTVNTDTFFVNSNTGYVSIGTNNPQYEFDVFSDKVRFGQDNVGYLILSDDSYGGELGLLTEDDESIAVKFSDGTFRYGGETPGNEILIIDPSTGRVGIGTITPQNTLNVLGTGNFTGNIYSGGFVNATADVCIEGGNCLSSVTDGLGTLSGEGTANYIPVWNGTTSLNNSVIYQSGENIGIGATVPAALLSIGGNGEAGALSVEGVAGSNIATFRDSDGENIFTAAGTLAGNDFALQFGDWGEVYGYPYFDVNTENISFMNGNVGIGTLNPDQLLTLDFGDDDGTLLFKNTGAHEMILNWNNAQDGNVAEINLDTDIKALEFGTTPSGYDFIWRVNGSNLILGNATSEEFEFYYEPFSGVTKELLISGYNASASGKETLKIGVGKYAVDTATFSGVNNYSFFGNVSSQVDFCIEGGNCLSNVVSGSETDPLWTANFSLYNSSWSSTYNSTYDTWAYNQTTPAIAYADATFLRNDGDNGTGTYNFGGSWSEGGVTINGGDLYAQSVYVYNISSLQVSNLNINGSLFPQEGFDATFDLGSSSLRWKDLYLSGNSNINGSFCIDGDCINSWGEVNSTINDSYVPYTGANQNVVLGDNNFSVGGTDLFVDNENGYVGIGTTSPSEVLEVVGDIKASGTSSQIGNLVLFSSNFRGSVSNAAKIYHSQAPSLSAVTYTFNGDENTGMYRMDSDKISLATGGSDRLVIDSSGNVGIGTSSPNYQFEVADNGDSLYFNSTSGIIGSTGRTDIKLYANDQNIFRGLDGWTGTWSDSVTTTYFQTGRSSGNTAFSASTGSLYNRLAFLVSDASESGILFTDSSGSNAVPNGYFEVRQNSGARTDFLIDYSGDVGIGTSSANQRLTVNGSTNISGDIYSGGFVNATTDVCIEGGNCLSDVVSGSETDPLWTANFSLYNSSWSSTYNASYVPYIGATSNLNLGSYAIYASNFKDNGDDVYVGTLSGNTDFANYVTGLGVNAANDNYGDFSTLIGYTAGYDNWGAYATAVGAASNYAAHGENVTSLGYFSGSLSSGNNTVAIGLSALQSNSGNDVVAIGYGAGIGNSASNKFIVQQSNVNATNLIYGDFATGQVNASDFCTYGGNCLSTVSAGSVGALTGEGTAGRIPLWNDTTSLNNSVIYQNSGNIGIGTANPNEELEVNGAVRSQQVLATGSGAHPSIANGYVELYVYNDGGTYTGRVLPYTGSSYIPLAIGDWNSGNPNIYLDTGGNVGIGKKPGTYKLDVGGNLKVVGSSNTTGDIYSGGFVNATTDICIEGGNCLSDAGTGNGNVSGGGIAGRLAYWTGSDILSSDLDLKWEESLERLGVRTSTPQNTLNVIGEGNFTGNFSVANNFFIDDSTGNVGIGEDYGKPGYALSILRDEPYIQLKKSGFSGGSSGIYFGDIFDDDVGRIIYNHTTDQIDFYTSAGLAFTSRYLSGKRYFGINVTSPSEALEVGGNINVTGDVCIEGGNCLSTVSASGLGAVTGAGTANYIPMWNGTTSLNNSNIYQLGTNIGIGTTTPQNTLNVIGNANISGGEIYLERNRAIQFPNSGGTMIDTFVVDTGGNSILSAVEDGGDIYIRSPSNVYGRFLNGGSVYLGGTSATSSPKFAILSGGNVGIGTTTPQNTLNVIGTGNFTGNVTTERIVFENSANNYIDDNSTCVKIHGATSILEIC